MKIDICIPVYRNLKSLQVSAWGIKHHLKNPNDANILLYVQEEDQFDQAVMAFSKQGMNATIVGTLSDITEQLKLNTGGAVHWMNLLFQHCTSPWMVMTEQDFFPGVELDLLAERLESDGYLVGAPIDTMYYDHPNTRHKEMYGRYGRLCGEPGFFHSALMVMNREWLASCSKNPFSMPEGYKWWGQGVFGGEWYYGIRLHVGGCKDKLAFFRQLHSDYAYGADIYFAKEYLGTHLYHSSKGLQGKEGPWREAEEIRFFSDYQENKLK